MFVEDHISNSLKPIKSIKNTNSVISDNVISYNMLFYIFGIAKFFSE